MVIWPDDLFLQAKTELLSSCDAREAASSVSLLLEHFLQITPTQCALNTHCDRPQTALDAFWQGVAECKAGQPVAYITGKAYFWSDAFLVGPGVLIPRQDTEKLVEIALDLLVGRQAPTVLDLCAGSGCVGAAIAKERPDAKVLGVEKEPLAFEWLAKNHRALARSNWQITRQDCLIDPTPWVQTFAPNGIDLIVANPPYITEAAMMHLDKTVQKEPQTALRGGADGLLFYEKLPTLFLPFLLQGGHFAFEIGYDQGQRVPALWQAMGLGKVQCFEDDCHNPRVVAGQKV